MGVGMGAAQEAGERRANSGGGEYLPNIYWKDDRSGEGKLYKKTIRFLTDDVITCKIYGFVKGGEAGKGRDFIAPGSLVNDDGSPIYPELKDEKDYFIENGIMLPTFKGDLKPAKDIASEQTLGLVVVREEYTVTKEVNGKTVAVPMIRDLIEKREWKTKDGEEKSEEGVVFGVVKQGYKNFWSQLAGYFNKYGTICDRDYEITRKGNNKDTVYNIIRLDASDDLSDVVDGETAMAHYKPELTLKDYIVPKAKYDAAKEWLTATPKNKDDDEGQTESSSAPATASADKDEDSGPVRGSTGSAADALRKELEDYKA